MGAVLGALKFVGSFVIYVLAAAEPSDYRNNVTQCTSIVPFTVYSRM